SRPAGSGAGAGPAARAWPWGGSGARGAVRDHARVRPASSRAPAATGRRAARPPATVAAAAAADVTGPGPAAARLPTGQARLTVPGHAEFHAHRVGVAAGAVRARPAARPAPALDPARDPPLEPPPHPPGRPAPPRPRRRGRGGVRPVAARSRHGTAAATAVRRRLLTADARRAGRTAAFAAPPFGINTRQTARNAAFGRARHAGRATGG